MSSGGRGRWGRSSRRDRDHHHEESEDDTANEGYVPPAVSGDTSNDDYNYVTSPPKKTSGLTGNISSLFRRPNSREPGKREHHRNSNSGRKGSSRHKSSRNRSKSREHHQSGGGNHPTSSSSPRRSSHQQQQHYSTGSDAPSVGSSAAGQKGGSKQKRLFYSEDDSDDSFESRQLSRASGAQEDPTVTTNGDNTYTSTDYTAHSGIRTILRYRGFSTSIQSLFLDEALVCASMGCFGLILSNRTEHLLQLRNDRRGVRWGRSTSRRTLPSRIVTFALLLTFIAIAITFVIWGFGSKDTSVWADGFYGGYDYYETEGDDNANYNDNYNYNGDDQYNDDQAAGDDNANGGNDDDQAENGDDQQNDDWNWNNGDDDDAVANDDGANANDDANGAADDYAYNNNNGDNRNRRMVAAFAANQHHKCNHSINGIFKIRDMHEGLWVPAIDYLRDEWYRDVDLQPSRVLEESSNEGGERDFAADLRISFIIAFLVVLGVLGRRRRMRTRYYLVRARAQEDHLFYASAGAGIKRVAFQDSREDQYEGACSHTLCGCYPTDPPMEGDEIDDEVKVDDDGVVQRKKTKQHTDCVSRGYACLMATCCGFLCKCWFQCLSVCALAQEAREMRLLVPTRYQRIDYITHQPFHEYQKDVNDLRRGWLGKSRKKSGMMPHLNALSRLSRYIMGYFLFCAVVIGGTLLFNPRASFDWPDAALLLATFLQSFLVLYLVHWIFHKSDLSLDAVIKFFAAGFMIAVPSAFFFEGVLVNLTLTFAYIAYSIGELIKGDGFVNWIVDNYQILWIFSELFNAYVVAAITEELCKYYTFRCVEHPDLVFLTGLGRASEDERAVQGGTVQYPFGAHQVEKTNKRGDYDRDDISVYSNKSSHRSSRSGREELSLDGSTKAGTIAEEFYEDEHDVRTYRQKAAAVTTGMISVAVGLACAENFLYVFLLGGVSGGASSQQAQQMGQEASSTLLQEWLVLLFRSIFPVHALAAAMQSVNMIRKFVECDVDNNHRVGVGRIILPAVIMHGSFDAVLLGINVYIESAWDTYLEANDGNVDPDNPPYNAVVVNVIAWISITAVMLGGCLWYFRENRQQRMRLIYMEEKEKANGNGNGEPEYTSPSVSSGHATSDMELV